MEEVTFYDEHSMEQKVVPYAQFKNILEARGYRAVSGTYNEDTKTISVERTIPKKWIVTIMDKEYTVYSVQRFYLDYFTNTFYEGHKQKFTNNVKGDWYTDIYIETDDKDIIEDCKYAFVIKENFDSAYVQEMAQDYPEYKVYFDIQYAGEQKDVDFTALTNVVKETKKFYNGKEWYLKQR